MMITDFGTSPGIYGKTLVLNKSLLYRPRKDERGSHPQEN